MMQDSLSVFVFETSIYGSKTITVPIIMLYYCLPPWLAIIIILWDIFRLTEVLMLLISISFEDLFELCTICVSRSIFLTYRQTQTDRQTYTDRQKRQIDG